MEIKVAIADDHRLFRMAIVNGLSAYQEINIVFEAEDGIDLLEKFKANPVDVILLDMEMPKMDGMTALKEIRKIDQEVKIIICTAHYEEKEMLELIEEKANGYLQKGPDIETIHTAIQSCVHIGFFFNIVTNSIELKSVYHI